MPRSRIVWFAGTLALTACAARPSELHAPSAPHGSAKSSAGAQPTKAAPPASGRLTELPVKARPELARAFQDERIEGTIALFDSASGELSASDPSLAKRAFSPASTFKIAHTAIALELGILDNPESPMPWDGQYSWNPEWNRDHTLRTAMQNSCFPCFQRLARSIGPEREQEWLRRLDYGNRDASGKVDMFWVSGKLRVTAIEQLDFLRRLDTGKLPISSRTLDIVREVIALDVGESFVLYGKTGLSGPPESDVEAGWFIGFVTLTGDTGKTVYFATLVTRHEPGVDLMLVRRRVTERILRTLGVLPEVRTMVPA
jgi:beta-lactamase class D